MSPLPPPQAPPPSWLRPIAIGSLVTLLSQYLILVLPAVVPNLEILVPCCCLVEALPLGVLPAYLALRQDPALTPGQGFAVSFIACGLGAAVMALIMILQLGAEDRQEIEQRLREALEQINREAGAGAQLTPEEIDAVAATVAEVGRYAPVVGACVFTVLAGLCGLFAVGVLRGRARAPRPPPP